MKKLILPILFIFMSSFAYASAVIVQQEAINQTKYAVKSELSNQINSQYSIMELPNGEHDGKIYGVVTFGSYKQDYSSEDKTPIEWYILEKRDTNAILISRNVIDSHGYDSRDIFNSWNASRLKSYLNGLFFTEAFTKEEQDLVISNPYREVGRVFILTPKEAKYYFAGPREILSSALPTARVVAESTYGAYKYWLEAQGDDDGIEYINGRLSNSKAYVDPTRRLGIRPCIVVNYDVNPILSALLVPEVDNQAGIIHPAAVTSTITGETIYSSKDANQNISLIYESGRITEVYNYKTEDDYDNSKLFIIKIVLPQYAGTNPNHVALINNLVSTQCFEMLKSYSTDYIESRIESVKKQLTIVPKPPEDLGNDIYSVEFTIGTHFLCTVRFDLRQGFCYSETE